MGGRKGAAHLDYAQYTRERITKLRLQKGVSEYKMSYDLGHSRGYVNNISSGKALPSMSEFFAICEYFAITPREFFLAEVSDPRAAREALQEMEALREDPASVRVGGTSSAGSMDHVQFLKVAQAAGIESLDQISYAGFEGGRVLAQLLGGHVDIVSAGIGDVVGLVESGDVRVLGITAEQRVGSGIVAEMPTCIEQGIDATFYNWRGIFGPKDMPEEARKFWEETLAKLVQTQEWADTCEKYGWDMDYLGRQEFEAFLAGVNEEYAVLLEQVGLLGSE